MARPAQLAGMRFPMSARPVIGLPADRRMLGLHPFHAVGEKYVHAVARAAAALPLLIPVLPEPLDPEEILGAVDGLLFTGSPSNVEPGRYGGDPSEPGTLHDPERDATTLALIPLAIARGIPVLGLCRGFQEMNVAFGGTLWQKVHEVPGMLDHREDKSQPLDVQYAPAHEVRLEEGGLLRRLAGGAATASARRGTPAARQTPATRALQSRGAQRGARRAAQHDEEDPGAQQPQPHSQHGPAIARSPALRSF